MQAYADQEKETPWESEFHVENQDLMVSGDCKLCN